MSASAPEPGAAPTRGPDPGPGPALESGPALDPGLEPEPAPEPGPEQRLQEALDRAYRYLGARERTEREMRAHLARAGVREDAIDEAVRNLTELGYLDDAAFARRFAQDKRELEAWGAERIARRLAELGVERDQIRAALAEDAPGEGELERAVELLRRRFPEPPADRRGRERALGVLLRKGYEPELALEALAASWSRT